MAFLKLKERKRLSNTDTPSLISLLKETITCTLSAEEIMKFGITKERAVIISQIVREVNIHHHTKTCRKFDTLCRFKYPRFPSNFHIIAQEPADTLSEEEKIAFWEKINFVIEKVKSLLDLIAEEGDLYENQLDHLLEKALPKIWIDN